jgi:uncharacterized protein (DUF2132 family)
MSADPLHGVTLENILVSLHQAYGWDGLSERMRVNCFKFDPTIKSCLAFFRKTPWARKKLELLYIQHLDALNQKD